MNTLACLFGMIAVGWFIYELIVVRSENLLGFAMIIVFAWLIAMTWVAIQEDREILGG
jgi:hypothetical protein